MTWRNQAGNLKTRPRLPVQNDAALRATIKAQEIIDEFQKCVRGEIELTREQVRCGTVLLHKVLPDMAPIDVSGTNVTPVKIEIVRFGQQQKPTPPMIDVTPPAEGEKVN